MDISPGQSVLVTIGFNPTAQDTYSGSLIVETNLAGYESNAIPLSGSGVHYPQISVSPGSFSSSLDYGTAETQTLTIQNLQGTPLNYSIALTENRDRDILDGIFDGFPSHIRGMVWIDNLLYLVDYTNAELVVYNHGTRSVVTRYPIHSNP